MMVLAVALLAVALPVAAQEYVPSKDAVVEMQTKAEYSPYVGREYPTNVYWGDTHLHTAVSVDAGTMCRLGQEDAFRFARTAGTRRKKTDRRKDPAGSECCFFKYSCGMLSA